MFEFLDNLAANLAFIFERLNWLGDTSEKGLRQSAGIMVNYLYDLEQIEANHERFVGDRVSASRAVLSLL